MNRDQVIQALRDFFQGVDDVSAVYLFGSVAAGRERTGSDVDVAILFADRPVDPEERLWRRVDLAGRLEDLLGRRADLIDFGAASPVVAHQILSRGVLVLERDRTRRILAEIRQRRLHRDDEPFRRRKYARLERFFRGG